MSHWAWGDIASSSSSSLSILVVSVANISLGSHHVYLLSSHKSGPPAFSQPSRGSSPGLPNSSPSLYPLNHAGFLVTTTASKSWESYLMDTLLIQKFPFHSLSFKRWRRPFSWFTLNRLSSFPQWVAQQDNQVKQPEIKDPGAWGDIPYVYRQLGVYRYCN